jgi:protein phosphatase inhibitor 2
MSTTPEIPTAASMDASTIDSQTAGPVKPALKKTTSKHQHHNNNNNNAKKKKGGLKWDEAKIEEHDKLRGTRMKIEEPNTPFNHNYDSGSETDGSHGHHKDKELCWDHLENKLAGVVAAQEAYPSSPSSHGGGDLDASDEDRQRTMKNIEFKEYRKRHYNEMELVRKFRQEHPDGPMSDAEDEDNDADDET